MSSLSAVSALFPLPSDKAGFLYLPAPKAPWPCCPFLLSKGTGEVTECPGWAGLVFPADWEGRSSEGAWSLPLLIAGIVFTWHFHTVAVLFFLPNIAAE